MNAELHFRNIHPREDSYLLWVSATSCQIHNEGWMSASVQFNDFLSVPSCLATCAVLSEAVASQKKHHVIGLRNEGKIPVNATPRGVHLRRFPQVAFQGADIPQPPRPFINPSLWIRSNVCTKVTVMYDSIPPFARRSGHEDDCYSSQVSGPLCKPAGITEQPIPVWRVVAHFFLYYINNRGRWGNWRYEGRERCCYQVEACLVCLFSI